jgi:Na+-transporting NADH:ubiquinone oxidoreductase subunit NqrB
LEKCSFGGLGKNIFNPAPVDEYFYHFVSGANDNLAGTGLGVCYRCRSSATVLSRLNFGARFQRFRHDRGDREWIAGETSAIAP